jgi:hypothetical protein
MTSGDGTINSGQDIYSYSQIIQGILILLSSIVAVGGYVVQSRAAKKQHILESRLEHLRNLLEKYVGPAQSLGSTANTLRMGLLKYVYHVHKGKKDMGYREMMDDIYGEGALSEVIAGNICEYDRLLSKEVENEIVASPNSTLAKMYRRTMRLMIYEYMQPLAKLLSINMGIFPLPSREEFKRRFPGHRGATLRKTFLLWQCCWTQEMTKIIEDEWDKGIYTSVFTTMTPYPTHCNSLLAGMLSDLKKEIETLTEGFIKATDNLSMQEQTKLSQKLHQLKKKEESGDKKNNNGNDNKKKNKEVVVNMNKTTLTNNNGSKNASASKYVAK